MKPVNILAAAVMVLSGEVITPLNAQDSFIGRYSGSYERTTIKGGQRFGVELTIASIENGNVKGTAVRYGRHCSGEYPVAGTFKDNRFELRSGKGGSGEDCTANFRLIAEGDKLKGTMGNAPVELTR